MQKGNFEIKMKRHAFRRAYQRGIKSDLITNVLQSGKIVKFGKFHARIEKEFRNFKICCVGVIRGNTIDILTITRSWKK